MPRRALLAALPAACATRPAPVVAPRGPGTESLFVVQRDWHTDIGLPVRDLSGPLARLASEWPGAESLVIGFGERAYLMSPQLHLGDMLAALLPGPGALLVTGLKVTPAEAFPDGTLGLRSDADGMARLQRYLAASFAQDAAGAPVPLREGPYAGARYFAAAPRYAATFTCNTWTAEALREAGLPVRVAGVVFASQVMEQVRRIGRT